MRHQLRMTGAALLAALMASTASEMKKKAQ